MRARIYDPSLGRFLQTDPIGYGDGMNMYAYVGGDPVNATDPSGTCSYEVWSKYRGKERLDGTTSYFPFDCPGFSPGAFGSGTPYGTVLMAGGGGGGQPTQPQQSGCTAARAARVARVNATASRWGPSVAFDSPGEMALLEQYFRGETTPYTLNSGEFAAAQAYVARYGSVVMGPPTERADGLTERHVYFGSSIRADPRLDALLGEATGVFRGNSLVGIRDTFNFDLKWRGFGLGYGLAAWMGTALVRLDAAVICGGDVAIPVRAGVR